MFISDVIAQLEQIQRTYGNIPFMASKPGQENHPAWVDRLYVERVGASYDGVSTTEALFQVVAYTEE